MKMESTRRRGALFAAGALTLLTLGACAKSSRDPTAEAADARRGWRLSDAQRSARAAQETRDPERAISLYRDAVTYYPEFSAAWNNLGVLLMDRKQYLEAAEAFGRAAEFSPRDPRPVYNLALAWDRSGYQLDALRFYKSALDRDPRFLPALRGALRIEDLRQIGDETTLERLRIALSQEPDPAWREAFELLRAKVEREVHPPINGMYDTARQERGVGPAPRANPPG